MDNAKASSKAVTTPGAVASEHTTVSAPIQAVKATKPAAAKAPTKTPAVKKVVAAKAKSGAATKTAVKSVRISATKPLVKPATRPAARKTSINVAKPVGKGAPAKSAIPVANMKSKKPAAKKPKLVRDSFTFPESDYELIAVLKQRALSAGREIKKSEVLRAGLAALIAMSEVGLLKALDGVERIKTGRPSK